MTPPDPPEARLNGPVIPVASVVVPAHNEAGVIERCLRRLLDGMAPGELDVVVVANGCTDDTAEIARGFDVRVLETPVAGKVHALSMGDAACQVFPRIYLDADVVLDTASAQALAASLAQPDVLGAAPRLVLDLTAAGPLVRRVHRVHDLLVQPHRALAGVGVYALSEQGHARCFPLPDVVSDDEWVHRSVAPSERRVVAEASSIVRPAGSVRAHLRRRVRVRLGNQQLARLGRSPVGGRLRIGALRAMVRDRVVTPLDAGCYLAVAAADRALSAWHGRRGAAISWAGDDASRAAAEPAETA